MTSITNDDTVKDDQRSAQEESSENDCVRMIKNIMDDKVYDVMDFINALTN